MLRLVIMLLVVLLFPVSIIAETTPLKIWSVSIFNSDIFRNKTDAYFSMLSSTIKRPYRSYFGADLKKLRLNCHKNKYDVIFSSYNYEIKRMEHDCNLVTIGLTDQDIHLLSLQKYTLDKINSIGVISFTVAKEIAEAELPGVLNRTFRTIEFSTVEAATLALLSGEVDAVVNAVTSKSVLASNFSKKIVPVHTFYNKGHAAVLFSKSFYDTKNSVKIREAIMRNGAESRVLFQGQLGLGVWYRPLSE